jgi:hypothetical protein
MSPEDRRLECAMNHSVAEGALATVMSTLLGGIFLTAFALKLGATRVQIGILSALPTLANAAQFAGAYVVARTGRSKRLCMAASWTSRLLWIPAFLVPVVMPTWPGPQQAWGVIAILSLGYVFAAIGGVAWFEWIQRLIPAERRIPFFGRRNLYNAGLSLGMSLGGALLVETWSRVYGQGDGGFLSVFAAAIGCGLLGLVILGKMPAADSPTTAAAPGLANLTGPFHDAAFRRLLLAYGSWNLANQLATPFFAVYMLERLQVSFGTVTALATFGSLLGLASNGFWTRLKMQHGVRPVVMLATLGDALLPFAWLFVTPTTLWLLLPLHAFAIFNPPLTMGPNNFVLKLSSDRGCAPFLASFNAWTGALSAAGAVLGGWLASEFRGNWTIGPVAVTGMQILFFLSGVGRLLSLRLLAGIAEQDAHPVRDVVDRLLAPLRKPETVSRPTTTEVPTTSAPARQVAASPVAVVPVSATSVLAGDVSAVAADVHRQAA